VGGAVSEKQDTRLGEAATTQIARVNDAQVQEQSHPHDLKQVNSHKNFIQKIYRYSIYFY
jgi:hypothetical protein